MMKTLFTFFLSVYFQVIIIAQDPFYLFLEQPDLDCITDVVHISDKFYFIQLRSFNYNGYNYDCYSDILITSEQGVIQDTYNLNGFDTEYHRILKVDDNDIYLAGVFFSDSCLSRIIISKFNIGTHSIEHLSSFDYCEGWIIKLSIINDLNQQTFIEATHSVEQGLYVKKMILRMDSTFMLTPIFEDLPALAEFSVDFSRKGYVIASVGLYDFYDADLNFRKQRNTEEFNGLAYYSTITPFRKHLMLEHTTQTSALKPDMGFQVRIVDSNLVIKNKVVIRPDHPITYYMEMPLGGGIDIQNEDEIWSAGRFAHLPYYDSCVYYVTKLDSNLNVICQHFLGYDGIYRLWGVKGFEIGGAIIYGNRVRDGLPINEGPDIFALRVGENCELPTVSTTDTKQSLVSISVYPNPSINSLTFAVNGFDPVTLSVEIFDSQGAIQFSKKDLSYEIKVVDLPAGQYFYRIVDGDKVLGGGVWVKQ